MYIQNITIENFRSYDNATVDFVHPGSRFTISEARFPNVTLLLGNNGSGKSAVLKACVLGILNQSLPSSGFRPYYLVRQKPQADGYVQETTATIDAFLILHDQDQSQRTSWESDSVRGVRGNAIIQRTISQESLLSLPQTTDAVWRGLYSDDSPSFFLVAYGANRRVEQSEFNSGARDKSRSVRYQRVASLFEEYYELVPPSTCLQAVNKSGRTTEFQEIVKKLFPEHIEIDPSATTQLSFLVHGTSLPFGALSDGYRAFIGWIFDLVYHLVQATPPDISLTDVRGVALVDEIDLFLHPDWQRIVVSKIANAFPNLQFICSTHSPILAGTVESQNILVTSIDETSKATVITRPTESIYGLSADQILTSSYFGLVTSRAPGAEEGLDEIAKRAWSGDDDAALEYLQHLARGFDPAAATVPGRE